MDILGQVLRALVGDHPPNGWTALIALGVCAAYVATNGIRAWHHITHLRFVQQASAEQLAKIPDAPKTMKIPSAAGIAVALFALFAAGTITRLGFVHHRDSVMAAQISTVSSTGPVKREAAKSCVGGCPPGSRCNSSTGSCEANARKPGKIQKFWDDIGDDGMQMTSELTIPRYWAPFGRGHTILDVAFSPAPHEEQEICQ